jgi:integrase
MKVDDRWTWFKLYTNKRASQRRWQEIIAEHEQRAAGVITPAMCYANSSINPHARAYLDALKLTVDPDHYRIAKFMLEKLIDLAGWKVLKDMTADSLRTVVEQLQANGKTVSYTNKFISRGKAFVHWLMEEPAKLAANPFASVKRGNVRKAKKNRARRAMEDHEAHAFIAAAPEHRRRKYLFAMLAGLRRKELRLLTWGDLRLNAPIPFIQLREEMTKNSHADALPLHPRLVKTLENTTRGVPGAPLFDSVPDVKTLVKDLKAGGVEQLDTRKRRIDFHALRHTFSTNLDRTGCSRATKKALMRHGDEDVTDGYSHAHLAELYEAICRARSDGAATVEGTQNRHCRRR